MAAVNATLESQYALLKDEDARRIFLLAGQFAEEEIIPRARLGLLGGIGLPKSKLDQPLTRACALLFELCLAERFESRGNALHLHPLVRDFSLRLVPAEQQASFRCAAAQRLGQALFVFSRLDAEVRARGVEQVIDDLLIALSWSSKNGDQYESIKLLAGSLRQSAHVIAEDTNQLAGQLLGRLHTSGVPAIQALLAQLKS